MKLLLYFYGLLKCENMQIVRYGIVVIKKNRLMIRSGTLPVAVMEPGTP